MGAKQNGKYRDIPDTPELRLSNIKNNSWFTEAFPGKSQTLQECLSKNLTDAEVKGRPETGNYTSNGEYLDDIVLDKKDREAYKWRRASKQTKFEELQKKCQCDDQTCSDTSKKNPVSGLRKGEWHTPGENLEQC